MPYDFRRYSRDPEQQKIRCHEDKQQLLAEPHLGGGQAPEHFERPFCPVSVSGFAIREMLRRIH
jgi:hypothetical protein